MFKLNTLTFPLILLALAGCTTVGPNYRTPAGASVNTPAAQGAFISATADAASKDAPPDQWWRLYDDPVLDGLITEALSANTDLRVAAANLARADAISAEADDASGPTLSASASAERARFSGESFLLPTALPAANVGDAGLRVSYQLDLFGKIRRAVEAAHADEDATRAAQDVVRVSVVADVARAYVMACAANAQQALAQDAVSVQEHRLAAEEKLVAAGRGTALDLTRDRGRREQASAATHIYEAQRREALFTLAALMGKPPADYPRQAESCTHVPLLKTPIPVGDGASLLRRRPDVRQAERTLAGATARIGVATADLYPTIGFGLSAGSTGFLADLGQPAANRWGVGSLISWTFPGGGERARIRAADANADAALARFDGVVLRALRETETSLSRYAQDMQADAALRRALNEALAASAQTDRLRAAGRSPYLTGLDAAQTRNAAAAAVASSDARLASDQITLFLALGGGWRS